MEIGIEINRVLVVVDIDVDDWQNFEVFDLAPHQLKRFSVSLLVESADIDSIVGIEFSYDYWGKNCRNSDASISAIYNTQENG